MGTRDEEESKALLY